MMVMAQRMGMLRKVAQRDDANCSLVKTGQKLQFPERNHLYGEVLGYLKFIHVIKHFPIFSILQFTFCSHE